MMPYRYRLLAKIAVVAMCSTMVVTTVPSCDTWDSAKADNAAAYIDQQIAATEKIMANPDIGVGERGQAAEQHEFWLKLAKNLSETKQGHADDAKAQHPAEDAITALGSFAGQYGALLTPLVPIAGLWLREQKWGKRLNQIIASIDAAKAKNPALEEAFSQSKDAIHSRMDLDTIKLVEAVRAKVA